MKIRKLLKTLPVLLILLLPLASQAQHQLVIYSDGTTTSYTLEDINSLSYSSASEDILINVDGGSDAYPLVSIEKILFIDELSTPENGGSQLPAEFKLENPYPNPFNPTASIPFTLPSKGEVKMAVVDILGRTVWSQVADLDAGTHLVHLNLSEWNGGFISSGTYFFRLNYDGMAQAKRLTVIK